MERTYKNKYAKVYLKMTPPLTSMPPVTPYDVEAIKALYENARKELAKYDHSKDIKTRIEFKPEQQNVADIV